MRILPALMLSTSLLVACSTSRPVRAETPAAQPPEPAEGAPSKSFDPEATPSADDASTGEMTAERLSDDVVMNVQLNMVRRNAKTSTALSSEMTIDEHRGASFEHTNGRALIQLNLSARPRENGDVLFFVHWRERSEDGEEVVEWSPTVLAKRGKPVTAKIDWAGGSGRSVTLTVN